MQRIMIIGQPGSGKSTLARQIGDRTGLPVYHIDHIHWTRGWVERSAPEKTRMCLEVHAKESWVFEGGHSVTWLDRLERAEALIWLDIPLCVRLYRIMLSAMGLANEAFRAPTLPNTGTSLPSRQKPGHPEN